MGFLDLFRSPEKQIELENKLLAKPGYRVAEVTAYNTYDREESYEDENGDTQWRTIRTAAVTFRVNVDGEWLKFNLGPEEGYVGFYLGQQLIVRCDGQGIDRFDRELRKDSPNRI